MQQGDPAWAGNTDTGLVPIPVPFSVTTPEVFNQRDPTAPILADTLIVRGTNIDGNPITVSINLQTEGGYSTDPRVFNIGQGEFELFIGVNEQAMSCNATLSGTGRVEIELFNWSASPLPGNIPVAIT
jgi:hypothetical protein